MALMQHFGWSQGWRLFVAVGFLGGFTTYSAFAFETLALVREGEILRAATYVIITLVGALIAVWLGFEFAKLVQR